MIVTLFGISILAGFPLSEEMIAFVSFPLFQKISILKPSRVLSPTISPEASYRGEQGGDLTFCLHPVVSFP